MEAVVARGRRGVVVLGDEERETLQRWVRRPKSSQRLALRCRIVLDAAAGETNKSIAAALGCKRGDGVEVAEALRGARIGRARRRAAAGRAAHGERRQGGGGDLQDAGVGS